MLYIDHFSNSTFILIDCLMKGSIKCPKLFPTPQHENLIIAIPGLGERRGFCCLISNTIMDLNNFDGGTQCFPRYYYEETENEPLSLFDTSEGEYKRKDGITDFIFQRCREMYGPKTSRDDIFYYVYGLLHSEDYRKTFENDLKKELPLYSFSG